VKEMNLIESDVLVLELKACFDFFWDSLNTNTIQGSPGYGLVVDRTNNRKHASMASVGFALSAYVVGVERGFITYEQGLERVKGTLYTLVHHVPHYKGFLAHFVDMITVERYRKCEYSTIDTAIVLNGALTVETYFDDSDIHKLVDELYNRVDWNAFVFNYNGKTMFRMAYNPDKDGAYANGNENGYIYHWHMPAEQLMMYFLAAGHHDVNEQTAFALYNGFDRYPGGYKNYQYIYSPGNALFIYQFSHAWFDFANYVDAHGFDWFENSRIATLANRQWCIDHRYQFKTFSENSWGLTACDNPQGYGVFGPEPLGWEKVGTTTRINGTVAPYGPASSVPFAPKVCIEAMEDMYHKHPQIWGEYGFKDAYNLENKPWYSQTYLGLDKGITILMLDNYLHGTTWKYYMENPRIIKAIHVLKFNKKG